MLVTKEYLCENCGEIEIVQSHKQTSKKCPTCKAKIERVISAPIISKLNEPRTIGAQLDLNNKKNPLSREKALGVGKQKKLEKESRMKKISKLTPSGMKRFLNDGIL